VLYFIDFNTIGLGPLFEGPLYAHYWTQ